VRGKLNKQIADELGTSERTIKAHRHAVMEKLKVHSLASAYCGLRVRYASILAAISLATLSTPGKGRLNARSGLGPDW
jgi:DNA-binding NarL/FixJ family response regulator